MNALFSGALRAHMMLLQLQLDDSMFKQDNPMEGIVLLIFVGVVIIGIVLYRFLGGGTGSSGTGKGKSGGGFPQTIKIFSWEGNY